MKSYLMKRDCIITLKNKSVEKRQIHYEVASSLPKEKEKRRKHPALLPIITSNNFAVYVRKGYEGVYYD